MTEPPKGHRSLGILAPLRVLFVCTANISRSPYAERRTRQAVGEGLAVSSAGIPGFPGRGMDEAMEHLLLERGGDGSGHVSRAVDQDMVEDVDLVVVFEFAHYVRLLEMDAGNRTKAVSLGQVAAAAVRPSTPSDDWSMMDGPEIVAAVVGAVGPHSMSFDVEDPYRRGPAIARQCANEIDACLAVLLPRLTGRPLVHPLVGRRVEPDPRGPLAWFRRS